MNKEQIRELIQETHAGIDGEVLEYLTDKINNKARTDEEATEQVKALTPTTIAQSYADARVNQAQAKWKQKAKEEAKTKQEEPKEQGQGQEQDDSTRNELDQLRQELERIKTERRQEQRTAKVNTVIGTLPEPLRKPFNYIDTATLTDEDFETFLSGLQDDVNQIASELPKSSFTPPRKAGVATTDTGEKEPTKEELEELIKLADI